MMNQPTPAKRGGAPWPEERAEKAISLKGQGKSASQIASELNEPGVTRNAVIGFLHRRGLSAPRPEKVEKPKPPTPKPERPAKKKPVPVVQIEQHQQKEREAFFIEEEKLNFNVSVLELKQSSCRFPVEGSGIDTSFCGRMAVNGYPYCEKHMRIASRKPSHKGR